MCRQGKRGAWRHVLLSCAPNRLISRASWPLPIRRLEAHNASALGCSNSIASGRQATAETSSRRQHYICPPRTPPYSHLTCRASDGEIYCRKHGGLILCHSRRFMLGPPKNATREQTDIVPFAQLWTPIERLSRRGMLSKPRLRKANIGRVQH